MKDIIYPDYLPVESSNDISSEDAIWNAGFNFAIDRTKELNNYTTDEQTGEKIYLPSYKETK